MENIPEKILPFLEAAVTARIRSIELMDQVGLILSGPDAPDSDRAVVETLISEWIDDYAFDAQEGISSFGLKDCNKFLEELAVARKEMEEECDARERTAR